MYSLVLMTALTTTPDAPEFGGRFRDAFFGRGCAGCLGSSSAAPAGCAGYSAPRYSCAGSAYPTGCSGSAFAAGCNGCDGGFLNRVRRWFDRGGCCGGSGSGYAYGCAGSGYSFGCTGSVGYSCFGSAAYSCFGGPAVSYTPVFNGGLSCHGGPAHAAPPPVFDPYPGSHPGSHPGMPGIPGMPTPAGPPATIPLAPPEAAPGVGSGQAADAVRPAGGTALVSASASASNRATVVVKLPVDARLYADNKLLKLTGAERKFVSPALPAGQDFVYRFRAEYDRDGETVSVTKKVPVRAGGSVGIEFSDLTAKEAAAPAKEKEKDGGKAVTATPTSLSPAAAAPTSPPPGAVPSVAPAAAAPTPAAHTPGSPGGTDRATITVKIPAGAALFVDDRRSPSNDPVRQFSTPPIPAGREFAYLMRVEVPRNGQTETFTQKVPFRAGERVEVDFTGIGR